MRRLSILMALTLFPRLLPAQGVLVAPHYLVIDHRTRSGSVTVYNPGAEPVEVTIGTLFGYPATDSAGEFTLLTPENPDSTLPSATGWIEAFPRRLSLGPRERQTVRLLGRPPAGLKDGEYWTRLVVTAKGGTLPVEGVSDTSAIQVGLTLEVRTILPVFYRKGTLETGVTISNLRTVVVGDSLEIRARMRRQGSGAFIGTLRGSLVDSTGSAVSTFSSPVAVYFDIDPRFTAPLARPSLPGRYTLRLELASEREDLSPDILLQTRPVQDSIEVRLP
jgi:P pilus assembly chaperone PapD